MRHPRHHAVLLPFVLLFGACKESDEESARALVDEGFDITIDLANVICDCWEEFGDNSQADCRDDFVYLPSEQRCAKDAYLSDAAAATIYLECRNALMDEMVACLNERLVCTDASSPDECFNDFDIGSRECIQPPQSILRDLDNCYD